MKNHGPKTNLGLPGWRSHLPSLWALIPIVAGLCFCEVLYEVASDHNLWFDWVRWRWSPWWPFYNDLAVTLDHFKAADHGLDPLADPQSTYAYPRAFLLLRHLRIQDIPSPIVGTVQAGLWMAAVIFVLRPRSFFRALLTTALFIAPSFVLGLEQGNVDMALFIVIVFAAVGWARAGSTWSRLWPITLVLLAAFLKMYPVFALAGGAWATRGHWRLPWVAAMVLIGAYWATHAQEISLIMSKFDLGNGGSWGCLLIFNRTFLFNLPHLWQIAVTIYACAFLVTIALGAWASSGFREITVSPREWTFYWFGAAICAGCFLTTNYDYRWVYVLLTVPLLLRVLGKKRLLPAVWASLTVLALAVSVGSPLYLHPLHKPFMIVQWANWILILLLSFGFMAMRPRHLQGEIVQPAEGASLRDPLPET